MANHFSSMGKPINMEVLRQQNKHVRAVGNMNVDAAGNTLDSHNNIISDTAQRVNRVYNRTTQNPGAVPRQHRPQPSRPTQEPTLDLNKTELQRLNEFDDEEPVGKSVR
jgi:hypothetical protein